MRKYVLPLAAALFAVPAGAQQPVLTAADYARAESYLSYNTEKLIDHGSVRPVWMPGDKFWYRALTPTGSEFILVDPAKKTTAPAFDHQKL
ncbi:MAG TPA: hypothetical protein VHB48_05475, partial [Chitinophagaceae bacterium]|nr:hypothetical protein [Chitinophagaceae bacterium]